MTLKWISSIGNRLSVLFLALESLSCFPDAAQHLLPC